MDEARKSRSNIAHRIGSRLLEAFGLRVGSEVQTPVVSGATLIQNRQRHRLSERPRQQSIKVSWHQDHIEGQVSPSSLAVPIQIGFDSHFVATASSVERCAAQARWLTFGLSVPPFPEVLDLPDQFAVIGHRLELLQVLLVVTELSGVEVQETRVTLQIRLHSPWRKKIPTAFTEMLYQPPRLMSLMGLE